MRGTYTNRYQGSVVASKPTAPVIPGALRRHAEAAPASFAYGLLGDMLLRLLIVLVLALSIAGALGGCASFGASSNQARATATAARPTATATTQERLALLARQAIANLGHQVEKTETIYDAQRSTLTVTVTVRGNVPTTDARINAAHELVKTITFHELQAVWTSGVTLHEATVIVLGPIQDEYDNIVTDWYGVAVIEARTAQRLIWASVGADSAWESYDRMLLRPSFDVVD